MPTVTELLAARSHITERPEAYEDLLLEPIIDDPAVDEQRSYKGWEDDHSTALRFYVGGVPAFLKATGLDATKLFSYRHQAHRRVLKETNWSEMADPKKHWQAELGKPQISAACGGHALSFAKAAHFLMACEIAVEDLISKGEALPEGFKSPQHIHGRMALQPAVWNITDFDKDFMDTFIIPRELTPEIVRVASLRSAYVVGDLSRGFTVTRSTAKRIHSMLTGTPRAPIGPVRARPGIKVGTARASKHEGPLLL